MIEEYAFCPKTGAPLSEQRHYDERGRPSRVPIEERLPPDSKPEGELTNGAVRSATKALFNYFRRCHQRHHQADETLYRRALLELRRLKEAATSTEEWDIYVWYALQFRLRADGYDTTWMDAHAEPRCPGCHGRLKYDQLAPGEVIGRCGANCTATGTDRLPEIRETLASLCSRAFDRTVDADEFLQF